MPAAPPISLNDVISRFRVSCLFRLNERFPWLSKKIQWNFYSIMSLIIRLHDVYIKTKNVCYFSVFYKLFHRDSELQFISLWCAPVTRVLQMLGNNYFKVKSLIPFSFSYFELLNSHIAFVNYEASTLRNYLETSTVSIISEQPSYMHWISFQTIWHRTQFIWNWDFINHFFWKHNDFLAFRSSRYT